MKKAPFLALVAVIVLLIGMWPPWPAGSQTTGITSQTQVVNSTAAAGTSSVIALDGKYSNCTVIAQTSTSTASVVVYGNTQATQYGPAAPNAVNSNFGSSGTITATTTQSQTSGNVANLPVGFYFTWSGNSGTLYAWAVCSSAIARAAAGATGAPGPTGPTGPPGPTGSPGAVPTFTASAPLAVSTSGGAVSYSCSTCGTAVNPPFALVQSGLSGSASLSVTFPKTAAAGDTLICILALNSGTPTAPSGYTQIFTQGTTSSTIYGYLKSDSSGAETSCAVTGSLSFESMYFMEISGQHSLDHEATASVGSSAVAAYYAVAPSAITPSAGAEVFVADCFSASGSVLNPAVMFSPAWAPTLTPPEVDTGINVWVYSQAGAGASLTPPSLMQFGVANTTDGVAVATFSIL